MRVVGSTPQKSCTQHVFHIINQENHKSVIDEINRSSRVFWSRKSRQKS